MSLLNLHALSPRSDGYSDKKYLIPTGLAVLSLLLYVVGIRFLYLPILIGVSAWLLPLPRIFSSWFGRFVVAAIVTGGLLQIAALLQFLIVPNSGFFVLAAATTTLHVLMWFWAPRQSPRSYPVISNTDLCGLVIVAFFLLPFTPIFMGQDSLVRIAQIGSTQAIDATNHFATIAELTRAQHLNYAPGYYYPKGFHIAVGFAQNSVFRYQFGLSWKGNVYLYFSDYVLYGGLLGYLLYFLCISWLRRLNKRLVPDGWSWPKVLTAICLAPPLVLLYLLPFVSEGFLSYYYVCIAFVCGALFLGELRKSVETEKDSLDLGRDVDGRWGLFAYLIVIFGAAATWPLLIPPFVLSGALFLLPHRLNWKTLLRNIFNWGGAPVIAAFVLQLLPIYYQLKYSSLGTSQSLNLDGGLKQFHPYILLLGLIIVVLIVAKSVAEESFKRLLINVFLPLFAFLGLFIFYQYFTTGTTLYYAIKVSLLVEMLLLILGVAALINWFADSKVYEARYAWLLPIVPFMVVLLLISSVANPLKDDRDLFRDRSNDVIPQYLGEDVNADVRLGTEGKIGHFNLMVLHYDASKGKYFADMQVPFWADMMQYDAGRQDFLAAQCVGQLYANLAFGDYSDATQQSMISILKQCVGSVRARGETFYVVTDRSSAPYIRKLLGSSVTVVND